MSIFEGSEKRLEISFFLSSKSPSNGLRSLSRFQIDQLLSTAQCLCLSVLSNQIFDAYVLSESSLFVFKDKCILKTCGNTHLLNSISELNKISIKLNMQMQHIKYSRASFLFPKDQPEPYGDFDKEVKLLKSHLSEDIVTGNHSDGLVYVLGNKTDGLQWHVFSLRLDQSTELDMDFVNVPVCLEICMTDLNESITKHFFKNDSITAKEITYSSGINELMPNGEYDEFIFDPCGYSMNGILDHSYLTIHVTPQAECSYASVEFYGFEYQKLDINKFANLAAKIFRPGNMYISLIKNKNMIHCKSLKKKLKKLNFKNLKTMGITKQVTNYGEKIAFGHYKEITPLGLKSNKDSNKQNNIILNKHLSISWFHLLKHKHNIQFIDSYSQINNYIKSKILKLNLEDTFYIYDLSLIYNLYLQWKSIFPRIEPFYAIKCNPDPVIIQLLARLGSSFDCATDTEMKLALNTGISANKIILANACKRHRDLRFAKDLNVNLCTFDTIKELEKIESIHKNCHLLLRIRADDQSARCQLGNKYGAEIKDVLILLNLAKNLNLNVIGVAFHVGSGAKDPNAFLNGIKLARSVFDIGLELGFEMSILNIGGGFPSGCLKDGNGELELRKLSSVINDGLDKYFPESSKIKIISEPGRYFVEHAAILAANIYGMREVMESNGERKVNYWITDGLYGSFNCIPYDHATVQPVPLKLSDKLDEHQITSSFKYNNLLSKSSDETDDDSDKFFSKSILSSFDTLSLSSNEDEKYLSTVFGPTCDGLDVVATDCWLPELNVGDWLTFPRMGAYTLAGASDFNGIKATEVDVFYIWCHDQCYNSQDGI